MTAMLIKKRGNEIVYPPLLLNKIFFSMMAKSGNSRNKMVKMGCRNAYKNYLD